MDNIEKATRYLTFNSVSNLLEARRNPDEIDKLKIDTAQDCFEEYAKGLEGFFSQQVSFLDIREVIRAFGWNFENTSKKIRSDQSQLLREYQLRLEKLRNNPAIFYLDTWSYGCLLETCKKLSSLYDDKGALMIKAGY